MEGLKTAGKVRIGWGSLKNHGADLQTLGNNALIVSGKSMIRQGYMDDLKKLLEDQGIQYAIYPEISAEPTVKMIEKGAELFMDEDCDFLIGFGGGSPIDAAKAIGLRLSTEDSFSDLSKKEVDWKLVPVAAIPTTAGTGSEVTRFTIVTDPETDTKMLIKGDSLIPAVAFIDPQFSLLAPKSVTVSSALDALTHAIEAFTSKKATSETDPYALRAIQRIFKYLPVLLKDLSNQKAREELAIAAYEAGIAFSNSSVTLVHGMSRPIGTLFHVPHGLSNAMLLQTCLEYAMPGAPEKFAKMGSAILTEKDTENVSNEQLAESFLKALQDLITECKVPTLREYGVDPAVFESKINKMAQDAVDSGSPSNTRRKTAIEDIKVLYREIIGK